MTQVQNEKSITEKESDFKKGRRKANNLTRQAAIQNYRDNTITKDELIQKLHSVYKARRADTDNMVTVSIKFPITQLVYLDLEVIEKGFFANRSELVRSLVNDFRREQGDPDLTKLLKAI